VKSDISFHSFNSN